MICEKDMHVFASQAVTFTVIRTFINLYVIFVSELPRLIILIYQYFLLKIYWILVYVLRRLIWLFNYIFIPKSWLVLDNAKQQIKSLEIKLNSANASHQSDKETWEMNLQKIEETWRSKTSILSQIKMWGTSFPFFSPIHRNMDTS